ncbi:MAG: endo-polygalacturonase [Verrucomicrobia bacterium]|nr:endo-polygalacturonase [Verrucomicrobiota bacterium]
MLAAMKLFVTLAGVAAGLMSVSQASAGTVRAHPAPAGEALSKDFTVKVEGQEVPVYVAKVAPAEPARRWKAMDDKANSADYFETASFAYFDMDGAVTVTVTCPEAIRSAKVLPSSFKIRPRVEGKSLSLTLTEPKPVTLEVNGDWVGALHLFANPPEAHAPRPGDPNVIYFGPGIHEVSHLVVSNNQTVYVAGGAVVRGVIRPDEPHRISGYSGLRTYSPTFVLRGTNITFRGRGIVDGSRCTTHARNLVVVQGQDIALEGVILRDSSTWTVPVRQSDRVRIKNVKLLGYRANSDGIDLCNSRDVTVEGCFIRTLDDLIVVKTDQRQGEARRIVARDCVLWNEVAHALSIGAESRENVEDVLFTNCDVIHDKGREWTLRVYHCDSARIRNVRFENLRIEESPRLISLWIDKAVWTRDPERGHIDQVRFKGIEAAANPLRVELKGFDAGHAVENVAFEDVVVNGQPLTLANVKTNAFVRQVTVTP